MADKYTTFGELDIGAYFFDPFSGEFFTKSDLFSALIETGYSGKTRLDEFEPDEIVIIEV
jgi:hypothetical protein